MCSHLYIDEEGRNLPLFICVHSQVTKCIIWFLLNPPELARLLYAFIRIVKFSKNKNSNVLNKKKKLSIFQLYLIFLSNSVFYFVELLKIVRKCSIKSKCSIKFFFLEALCQTFYASGSYLFVFNWTNPSFFLIFCL